MDDTILVGLAVAIGVLGWLALPLAYEVYSHLPVGRLVQCRANHDAAVLGMNYDRTACWGPPS
jgi:hypothetical protein